MATFRQFGQPGIRTQLDTILAQGRLPHAMLFYGEPGAGILPGALSMATDILCTASVDGKACGQCPSCHRTQQFIHPDLHFLLPLAGAKSISTDYYPQWREAITANPWLNVFQWTQYSEAEGKQVDIHKEDIAQATSNFNLEAYEGGNKVMIIWMAQFLAKEGNRLLKMIEEPQPGSYFILVSNQRDAILPTIRSRCMQVFFPPLPQQEIEKLLREQHQLSPEKAAHIARQSGNDMNRAVSLIQNTLLDFVDELTTWFRALLNRKGQDLVAWSTTMGSADKEEQKQFALFVIAYLRKLLWAGTPAQPGQEALGKTEMMQFLQNNFTPDTWQEVMEAMQLAHEKIARNANTKLLWLACSLQIKNHLAASRLQHINA
jgi:DNA polymerase-3 subunit delta'